MYNDVSEKSCNGKENPVYKRSVQENKLFDRLLRSYPANRKMRLRLMVIAVLCMSVMATGWSIAGESEKKVNINTASVEELTVLNGVGSKVAARIVSYREEHGPFQHPVDLMNVKGIGPKLYERNQTLIVVGPAAAEQ